MCESSIVFRRRRVGLKDLLLFLTWGGVMIKYPWVKEKYWVGHKLSFQQNFDFIEVGAGFRLCLKPLGCEDP